MQLLAGHTDGQAAAVTLAGDPVLPMPRSRVATVEIVVVQRDHQHPGLQSTNRLYGARGQPDTTHTGRTWVRSRIIQEARSLATRRAIKAVLNHGIYLTEHTEPTEGPAPSLIPPDCTSPGWQARSTAGSSPPHARNVTAHARAVRSFFSPVLLYRTPYATGAALLRAFRAVAVRPIGDHPR